MTKYSSKDAFYKRINQLAETKKTPVKESRTIGTLVNYERGADGVAYGIIKENHNYYIKKAGIKKDLNESDFAYIGGLENITNYQYSNLTTADKQRNMMLTNINEAVKSKLNKNNTKININEDVAGDEIEKGAEKIPDLDAATDAEATSDMSVDPTADGIDQTNPIVPDLGDEDSIPEPTADNASGDEGGMDASMGSETEPTGEEMPTGDEMPTSEPEGGEEEGPIDGATMTTDDGNQKDIEKLLGKLTNNIRKTEMEPIEVKSALNTFISAFKDKLPELEIEDRKAIANKIIKVIDGGEEDLENSMPDEEPVEETQQCAECGGFTQYAESRGYTKESIMECDNEEMGSLIGGYATAHGDGKNDGDGETVSLFTNDEIAESLKNDYGHDKYVTEVLEPHMNKLMEGTQDDTLAKINELSWGGIKNAVGSVGSGIKNAVSGVGQGKVADMGANIKAGVQGIGKGMQQGYNKGVQNDEVQSINKLAQELKTKIESLNQATVKAGGEPIDPKKIIDILAQQLTVAPPSSIANNPGAQKAFQNRNAANMGSLAMKENVSESVDGNALKVTPKSPPALQGKKNTEIMAGGKPTNNTTAFKVIGKNPPALSGKLDKTIMGENEVVESVNALAKSSTAKTTATSTGGNVNTTGFKVIGKSAPAQPGAGKKTIMGESGVVDAGNIEVQPNMIKEIEEVEPDNDADDKSTGLDFGGGEDQTPEITVEPDGDETQEIGFAPEAQSMGVLGTEPKGVGTVSVEVDGNAKTLSLQINEVKSNMKKLNEMIDEISTGLAIDAGDNAFNQGSQLNQDDPILSQKRNNQGQTMGKYINPNLKAFLASKGLENIYRTSEGMIVSLPTKNGSSMNVTINPTKYYLEGSASALSPELLSILPTIVKRIQADIQVPKPNNQLESIGGMNESETKVRKYIRQRIEEKAGMRKPSLNENTKSNKVKELDNLIDEQYKIYKKINKK